MRTIRLTVEYDGTEYTGWQYQTNGCTIQGVLEEALRNLLQDELGVTGAGRTDAGVHARGQVAHFQTRNEMDVRSIQRGVNALLPADIVVRGVEDVDENFHARYSALWRKYRYTVAQEPIAIGRSYAWFWGQHLDEHLMQQCAQQIIGEHDFQAFSRVDTDVKHFRCTVRLAAWMRKESLLILDIEANRFLYGMVRALVGTMVEIGRGYRPFEDFARIMASRDRRQAGMAAPAAGLVLEKISYDSEGQDNA